MESLAEVEIQRGEVAPPHAARERRRNWEGTVGHRRLWEHAHPRPVMVTRPEQGAPLRVITIHARHHNGCRYRTSNQ